MNGKAVCVKRGGASPQVFGESENQLVGSGVPRPAEETYGRSVRLSHATSTYILLCKYEKNSQPSTASLLAGSLHGNELKGLKLGVCSVGNFQEFGTSGIPCLS